MTGNHTTNCIVRVIIISVSDKIQWKSMSCRYRFLRLLCCLSGVNSYAFLDGCKSVCGEYGSLWPRPTKMTDIGSKLAIFNIEDLAPKYDTSHLLSDKVTLTYFCSILLFTKINCMYLRIRPG